MRVEVSIGEVIDKMSILSIKMEKITDPAKNANVTREYESLCAEVNFADYPGLVTLYQELCDVNLRLWDIEDGIRLKESRKEFDQEFINLARSVYYNNDKRFEIKREINALCKSDLIEEKQHQRYQ